MKSSLKRLVKAMGKNSLHGWKKVYAFTFVQNMKGTGNRIFFLVLLLLALVSMPLLEKLFPGSDTGNTAIEATEYAGEDSSDETASDIIAQSDTETSPIEHLYFYNEAQFPMESFDGFVEKNPYFADVDFTMGTQDFDTWLSTDKNENSKYDMHVTLSMDENGFFITCAAPLMSHLDSEDLEAFELSFRQYLNVEKLTLAGLSEADITALETPVNGSLYQINEEGNMEEYDDSFTWDNSEYGTTYGILLLTIFLIAFCAESIAVSVLTEKSSKVVETLLLSVRPMATIVGKVLASISVLLVQFAGFFLGLAGSCLINGYMQKGTLSFLPASSVKGFLSLEMFHNVSPGLILLSVAILLTGVLFYGVLAGIFGASVSRMEEIGEALKLYNLLYILGAYFALAVAMASAGGLSVLNYVAYLFPLSAPFIAPTHLLIGKMPLWIGLLSFAFLVLMVVLAFLFASRIYANMLFYNGRPMKFKDFIRFAKQSKKEDL